MSCFSCQLLYHLLYLPEELCSLISNLYLFSSDLSPESILVTDSLFVTKLPAHSGKIYELPITHSAKEILGKALFANIIALGALVKITKIVSEESLIAAVLNRVPKGTEEVNKQALQIGMDLVKE